MYFYLDSNLEAKFLDELPDGNNTIIKTMKWPYNYSQETTQLILIIATELHEKNSNSSAIASSQNFSEKNLAILRSHLQKSTRRQAQDLGMKTIIALGGIIQKNLPNQVGLFEMLRRLTIIIIEDCVLIRDYVELVWYLCAISKNYIINKILFEHILEIAYKIFNNKFKDKAYKLQSIQEDLFDKIITSKLENQEINLLLSIQLRNSFHGMSGDINMLNQSTKLWLSRISTKNKLTKYLDQESQESYKQEYQELTKQEFLIYSLDHHCTNLANQVADIYPIEIAELESLLWDFWSSVNTRQEIPHDLQTSNKLEKLEKAKESRRELWDTLEPIVELVTEEIKSDLTAS